MIYVFFQYWIFVALAFVLGLFVGWATCTGHDHDRGGNWLAWAVAAFLAGLFLAGFKSIPGLLGHLLEVALMLFAAYIVGCITGCGARSATSGDDGGGAHGHSNDDRDAHGHARDDGHGHADAGGQGSGAHASAPQSTTAGATSPVAAHADAASPGVSSAAPAGEQLRPATAEAAASPPASATFKTNATTAGEAAASPAVSSETPAVAATATAIASDAKASAQTASTPSNAAADLDASAASRATMTDGQRSILAAKEKLALQRRKAAAAPAPVAETIAPASAPSPTIARAALLEATAQAPRAAMTDGQRSILAARQKMAEKAAKAAAREAESESTPSAAASAAAGDVAGNAAGGRPAADPEPASPADDLKLIKGVGPKNEAALNGLGVRRFAQIADWNADNEKWVGHSIKFPGRIEREHWVAQAKLLAAGIETPHAAAVKSGAIKIDESADAPLSDEEAKTFAASLPQQAPQVEDERAYGGARPLGLAAPNGGNADDLKRIKGIGRQNEERLHKLGVWHFDQVAAWTAENVKWVGSYLAFPGRIDREQWIAQAASLARGEPTEFSRRVDAGDVPTSTADERASKLI